MEIVVVKVRPSYNDKKLHVFRFLFPDGYFSFALITSQLRKLFPFGFYAPKIERFMIDFDFPYYTKDFVEICSHDYLAKYLTSSEKLE